MTTATLLKKRDSVIFFIISRVKLNKTINISFVKGCCQTYLATVISVERFLYYY